MVCGIGLPAFPLQLKREPIFFVIFQKFLRSFSSKILLNFPAIFPKINFAITVKFLVFLKIALKILLNFQLKFSQIWTKYFTLSSKLFRIFPTVFRKQGKTFPKFFIILVTLSKITFPRKISLIFLKLNRFFKTAILRTLK